MALPFHFAYLIVSYLFVAWENSFPSLSLLSAFKGGREDTNATDGGSWMWFLHPLTKQDPSLILLPRESGR